MASQCLADGVSLPSHPKETVTASGSSRQALCDSRDMLCNQPVQRVGGTRGQAATRSYRVPGEYISMGEDCARSSVTGGRGLEALGPISAGRDRFLRPAHHHGTHHQQQQFLPFPSPPLNCNLTGDGRGSWFRLLLVLPKTQSKKWKEEASHSLRSGHELPTALQCGLRPLRVSDTFWSGRWTGQWGFETRAAALIGQELQRANACEVVQWHPGCLPAPSENGRVSYCR